jgi:hypothetical protein
LKSTHKSKTGRQRQGKILKIEPSKRGLRADGRMADIEIELKHALPGHAFPTAPSREASHLP